MLRAVSFFVLILIVVITGYPETFVLENKITGKVLGGESGSFGVEEDWENGDWQLWDLERTKYGYSILRNVASRIILTHPNNRSEYQLRDVDTDGNTWIQLNRYVLVLNRTALYFTLRENDEKDRWFLVQQSRKGDIRFNITVRGGIGRNVLDACPWIRAIFTWSKNGGTNQKWKLDADETRIKVKYYPHDFMIHKNNNAILYGSAQSDNSDIWLLVEPAAV